jgi:Fe2+ transport system protein B
MQTEKIFEFASIDLIKKLNTTITSYNETMSENFQQLEKTMKQKMTKLIIEQLNSRSNQSRSEKRVNDSKNSLIKSTTAMSNSKKNSHFSRRIQAVKKSQSSEKIHTSVEKASTSISSSSISSTWAKVISKKSY